MSVMSPWPNQEVSLVLPQWSAKGAFKSQIQGAWQDVTFELPAEKVATAGSILVRVSQVHAPISWQKGDDARRLGIAVKNVIFGSSAPAVLH